MSNEELKELKEEFAKGLRCLYLEVPHEVASDVSNRCHRYAEALEKQIETIESEGGEWRLKVDSVVWFECAQWRVCTDHHQWVTITQGDGTKQVHLDQIELIPQSPAPETAKGGSDV